MTVLSPSTFAQLPQCAQSAVVEGYSKTHCGSDLSCICVDYDYFKIIRNSIAPICSPTDQNATFGIFLATCRTQVPSIQRNRGREIVATTALIMTLATVAVVLRLLSHKYSQMKLGISDYLIMVSLVFTYGLDIVCFLAVDKGGFGRHDIMLNPEINKNFEKLQLAFECLFPPSITLTKVSILFFYRRIFPMRRFTICSLIVGCITIGGGLSLVLTAILGCRPLNFAWDPTAVGHCVEETTILYTVTGINLFSDIIVLALPLPWVWKLQMETSRKISIMAIFLLGSFICISGVVRIPFLHDVNHYDMEFSLVDFVIWVNVECNIGIVSACIPAMRPLFNMPYFANARSRIFRSAAPPHRGESSQSLQGFNGVSGSHGTIRKTSVRRHGYGHIRGGEKHSSWYLAAVEGEDERYRKDNPENNQVPLGRNSVKHEIELSHENNV